MNLPILFEDDAFLAVNKPSGIVVNRAESVKGETVQDWVEEKYHVSSITYQVSRRKQGFLIGGNSTSVDKKKHRGFFLLRKLLTHL